MIAYKTPPNNYIDVFNLNVTPLRVAGLCKGPMLTKTFSW
jgi:hypothetical protein